MNNVGMMDQKLQSFQPNQKKKKTSRRDVVKRPFGHSFGAQGSVATFAANEVESPSHKETKFTIFVKSLKAFVELGTVLRCWNCVVSCCSAVMMKFVDVICAMQRA